MSGKQMYTTREGLGLDTHDSTHPPQPLHFGSHTYRLLGLAAELDEGMVPYAQGGLRDMRIIIIPWGGCGSHYTSDSCACILDSITSDSSKIIAILICIILLA